MTTPADFLVDNDYLATLLVDYESARSDDRAWAQLLGTLFGILVALLGALAAALPSLNVFGCRGNTANCHPANGFLLAVIPVAPVAVIAFAALIGLPATIRSYYMRGLEKEIRSVIGNFGLAILLLTVIVKLLFFPLANKSYKAMSKMKLLQPEMLKLREKYGEDKAKLNEEMMALYKRVGANPLAGCLPVVIQIPVFFSLYKVLFVTIEMRHAPFYGWIHDLSSPDPTSLANLFGLLPFDPSAIPVIGHVLMIGAWPLIMGCTMFLQQKLNPQPADPVQAKMFMFLPIVFTYMLSSFPAGLVIYWAWNNTLSVLQQWVIMRRAGAT